MTEFTANAKSIFDKAKAARTDILNLDPSVQRIDDYAGTKFTPTVDQFRSALDGMTQKQKETAVDLSGAINNYFMFHAEANNPDYTTDIITEFGTMIKMFDTKAANADISESNNTLVGQVNAFSTQLASTLKIKDKAIDDELTAATSEVTGLDNEIAAIDAQLTELRKQGSQGNISQAIGAVKDALAPKKATNSTATGTTDDDAAIKEQIKALEAQRATAVGTRQTARDRRNQASAASDARNNANTPATMSALSKAQMDLATYGTQSANLTTDWNAMATEVKEYCALFVANRDQNTPETKSALSSHIAKVASKKATMEAFATSLKNNAFNA